MTIQRFANDFEMVTPRPARYSLGASVLAIFGLSVIGWGIVALAIYSFL